MKISVKIYKRAPISVGVVDANHGLTLWCYTSVCYANENFIRFADVHLTEQVLEESERYYQCRGFNTRRL